MVRRPKGQPLAATEGGQKIAAAPGWVASVKMRENEDRGKQADETAFPPRGCVRRDAATAESSGTIGVPIRRRRIEFNERLKRSRRESHSCKPILRWRRAA